MTSTTLRSNIPPVEKAATGIFDDSQALWWHRIHFCRDSAAVTKAFGIAEPVVLNHFSLATSANTSGEPFCRNGFQSPRRLAEISPPKQAPFAIFFRAQPLNSIRGVPEGVGLQSSKLLTKSVQTRKFFSANTEGPPTI